MKDIQIGPMDMKDKTTGQRTVSSIIWLISTARNIIVVVFCAALGYMYKEHGNLPFKLSSNSSANYLFYIFLYISHSDSMRRSILFFFQVTWNPVSRVSGHRHLRAESVTRRIISLRWRPN